MSKDSGDKTEKPTPKKLRDARKKGDVPKSKEVTSTLGLMAWLMVLVLGGGFAARRVSNLAGDAFAAASDPSPQAMLEVGQAAGGTLVLLVAIAVTPVIALSLLTEFAQVGPVFAAEKLKFKMEKLNPAEGLKKMVSMDNWVEVIKALLKTILIGTIGTLIVLAYLPQVTALPQAAPASMAAVMTRLVLLTFGATLGCFFLVAGVDAAYQRYSFTKKQKMSLRDIKQEYKEQEGDPHLKSHRKQTALEQSQQSPAMAARQASVLLTNPTHLAVAIHYDQEEGTVPVVTGKGVADVAGQMRRAAAQEGVPTMRDVPLARALYRDASEGEAVPEAHFDAVAQLLVWAQGIRDAAQADDEADAQAAPDEAEGAPA